MDFLSLISVKWLLASCLLLSLLAVIFNLILFLKLKGDEKKLKIFLKGKNGQELEPLILENSKEIESLNDDVQELYDISGKIHSLASRGLCKAGMIRFNPFNDIGGDQSFSLALIDGKNCGFVLSSLHTKENTRVYLKPIIEGKSEKYPLTEEEKEAVATASLAKNKKFNENEKNNG